MNIAQECADCGASFGSPGELVRHMATAHGGGDATASLDMNPEAHRPGFVCGLCGARFPTPTALARHNLRPHGPAGQNLGPVPKPS
jgi:hypothetical protein